LTVGAASGASTLGYAPSHICIRSVAANYRRRRRTAAATAKPPRP